MENKLNSKVKILEGRSIATEIYDDLDHRIGILKNNKIHPHLAVILVGNDKQSEIFVNIKRDRAEELGVDFSLYKFEQSDPKEHIDRLILELNKDREIHGIIVQLPLPSGYDRDKIIALIEPKKDVDALNSTNYTPPTANAIWQIIRHYNLPTEKILVIGDGILVGRPIKRLFDSKNISYVGWQENDFDSGKLSDFTIVISGTGQKKLICENLNMHKTYLIDGSGMDVDFEKMFDCCAGLTPSIGGVGPLTVASLLENTVIAAEKTS